MSIDANNTKSIIDMNMRTRNEGLLKFINAFLDA